MNKRTDFLYKSITTDRYTPYSLAKKLDAKGIFESMSFANGRNRYSILMIDEAFKTIQDDEGIAFLIDGKRVPFDGSECVSIDAMGHKKEADVLDAISYIAKQNPTPQEIAGIDVPLPASGMGYLSYEFALRCDNIKFSPQENNIDIPESAFISGHIYIIFDHYTEQLHIFGLNYNEHSIDLTKEVQRIEKRINDMDFSYIEKGPETYDYKLLTDIEASKADYIYKVTELKKHIVAGNIIQAVPSRRVQIECDAPTMEVYGKLRKVNPSPYLFYINFNDFTLLGSSPESLVKVQKGIASIHPIAGTIRRGKNEAEDAKFKQELLNNPKERCEHLMLVDLARNDLGRVCDEVTVPHYMECELYSHVIHLVSDTQGKLREGIEPVQVLRASFPAGTVSGAPKISAMQIISGLEKEKRNFYAGAVGYIESNGDLDFCIAIRSTLCKDKVWTLQAGAGIVYDSNPEREFVETNEKLGALIDTLTK